MLVSVHQHVDLENNNKLIENHSEFFGCTITVAAMNLFQVDRDKPWDYLVLYCYEKAPLALFPPFQKAGGNATALRCCCLCPKIKAVAID